MLPDTELGGGCLDTCFQLPATLGVERLDALEQYFLERSILDRSRKAPLVAV